MVDQISSFRHCRPWILLAGLPSALKKVTVVPFHWLLIYLGSEHPLIRCSCGHSHWWAWPLKVSMRKKKGRRGAQARSGRRGLGLKPRAKQHAAAAFSRESAPAKALHWWARRRWCGRKKRDRSFPRIDGLISSVFQKKN
jgi:hypothetical protein